MIINAECARRFSVVHGKPKCSTSFPGCKVFFGSHVGIAVGLRVRVGGGVDLARFGTIRWSDETFLFHDVEQASGTGIPDFQLPLEQARRSFAARCHDAHGIEEQIVATVIIRFEVDRLVRVHEGSGTSGLIRAHFRFVLGRVFVVLRESNLLRDPSSAGDFHGIDHALDFLGVDVDSLDAYGLRRARCVVQHVAFAEQIFGADGIENGSAVDGTHCAECHARGDVRFNKTGDDVDRRALRGDDEVHARCARHLGDADDHRFRVAAELPHHEVREFVDDDDDAGEEQAFVLLLFVVFRDVSHAHVREAMEAATHFRHGPAQCLESFFGLGDHRGEQVRNTVVRHELDALGIDEDEFQFVRRVLVEERRQEDVHRDGFTRSRGTRDEQVGHVVQGGNDSLARHVAPERERKRRLTVVESRTLEDFAEPNHRALAVGHFDAHEVFAGNRRLDA